MLGINEMFKQHIVSKIRSEFYFLQSALHFRPITQLFDAAGHKLIINQTRKPGRFAVKKFLCHLLRKKPYHLNIAFQ